MSSASETSNALEPIASVGHAIQDRSVPTWEAQHLGAVPGIGAPAVSVSVLICPSLGVLLIWGINDQPLAWHHERCLTSGSHACNSVTCCFNQIE
jgi:hypothetical protein